MDIELITRAAAYAAEAHKHQTRKASPEPYVNHVLRVAHMAVQAGLSAEAVSAALLHDVVEDTRYSQKDIEAAFPPRVADLVDRLTQWWPDDADAATKAAGKPKYYARILEDAEAIDIKLLDRADNLQDMARMLPKARGWAERYMRRTEEEIKPMLEASKNEVAKRAYTEALRGLKAALRK
ncbi:MAG: HD domain-containing protein [Candidatus Sericytochromatia bacterium]